MPINDLTRLWRFLEINVWLFVVVVVVLFVFCFCLSFSTVSICTDNMHLLLMLMWHLRFLTEMLTKEFCLGLKLQFAEAAYGQQIQDYYLIREIKTWLNINAYGKVLLCKI